jgi:hypothetical protein
MQQNEELSRQAHTREFLQNYPGGGMWYQGHGLHYEFGRAIPEMYYRRDGYDSNKTTPREGYYDNFAREKYANDLQGSYGFQDSIGYHDDDYHEYDYYPYGVQESPFHANNPL